MKTYATAHDERGLDYAEYCRMCTARQKKALPPNEAAELSLALKGRLDWELSVYCSPIATVDQFGLKEPHTILGQGDYEKRLND